MSQAQPYGYYVPAGGQPPQVIPQGVPVMGPPAMMPAYMPYGGQPQMVYQSGMGRRGRGKSNSNPNLVVRVKAEIGLARPGQILEIAREAATQLSIKGPQLYADFLKGLTGVNQVNPVTSSPVVSEEKEEDKKPTSTESSLLVERKKLWKEKCAEHTDVSYWQEVQDKYKKDLGPQCEVDKEILADDSTVSNKKYHRGKLAREDLLTQCGLVRVPGGLALDPVYIEQAKQQAAGTWMSNPLAEAAAEKFMEARFEHDERLAELENKRMQDLSKLLREQAELADRRMLQMMELLAKQRHPSPPPKGPPAKPGGEEKNN